MPRVAFCTLGCKVNQYESQKMAESLLGDGFDVVDFSDQADVYIVNSCTVTSVADSKSRQAVRAAARRNPGALVVLTGCFVETSREQAEKVEGVSLALGNNEKLRVAEYIKEKFGKVEKQGCLSRSRSIVRTRALLKIQDGCDQFCAYCAVPLARPVMSSRAMAEVLDEVQVLAERGHKEVVLTGIRLGRYDDRGLGLVDLIKAISAVAGIERIRLSSIEFTDVPDGLLDLMASDLKLCPHLHLPVQSGSDDVLRRMNRPYNVAQFERFISQAREAIPDIAITTDVMVGFPGETEKDFKATCELLERVRFARVHVFRYSPRPGTRAAEMCDDVPAAVKKRRSDILIEMATRHKQQFERQLIGRTLSVLVEGNGRVTKFQAGMTNNYVRVKFLDGSVAPGEIVNVRIERVDSEGVYGVRC